MRSLMVLLAVFAVSATTAFGQARLGTPGYDAYEAGNYPVALQHWLPEAEAGDADIQARIAQMYLLGEGMDKDPEKAVHWYTKSAEQNFGKAQYQLGRLYASGTGVEKDPIMAFTLWSAATENGAARASSDLAELQANFTPNQQTAAAKSVADWWEAHPLPVEEEVIEVDNRTAMQKFNDWILTLLPEGMVSRPRGMGG